LEQVGALVEAARFYERAHRFKQAAMLFEEQNLLQDAARCYENADNLQHAAILYQRAQDLYKTGYCLFELKRYDDALRVFQRVHSEHPNYKEARKMMGFIHFFKRDFNVAQEELERLIRDFSLAMETENLLIFYRLAQSLEGQGKLKEAVKYFERIYSRQADFKSAYVRMKQLQKQLGIGEVDLSSSQTADPQNIQIGTVIADRFAVVAVIGKGGMGAIYEVKDIALDKNIALKVLLHSAGHREELKAELITARELAHPYIIKVFDIGEWGELSYFTMELVKGDTLKNIIEQRKLSFEQKITLMRRICEGVHAAHAQHIIHRDIKPQNILVNQNIHPKILDFGIARSLTQPQTNQGISGSPKYMAPEQILNENLDVRTDIYALGILFFYLFVGKEPFVAPTANQILSLQMSRELPHPATLNPHLPVWICDLIIKATQKNRHLRFNTIEEMLQEIRDNQSDTTFLGNTSTMMTSRPKTEDAKELY
jgi:Tfp pilus assembly protein PilF